MIEHDDGTIELTEDDFSTITEADLAILKLAANAPRDDFDYSTLWADDD